MNPLVFEYLVFTGALTASTGNAFDFVELEDTGSGVVIVSWTFPEAQLTAGEIATVQASAPFVAYVADRDNVRDREDKKIEADNRLLKAIVQIITDEINILRVNDGLAARTNAQVRTAIRNKIDAL